MFRKTSGVFFALALAGCGGSSSSTPGESAPPPKAEVQAPASPAQADISIETVAIAGQDFSLDRSGDNCFLKPQLQERLALNMPPSCRFHRLKSGEIQVRDGHHGPVFLVISTVKETSGTDCDTRIAAVTISEGKTYVEPAQSGIAACYGDTSLDDIFFLAPRFEGLTYPGDE